MSELRVEAVEAFHQPQIQGEKLPDVPPNFPFSLNFLDGLVELCPVVIDNGDNGNYRFNVGGREPLSQIGLRRISPDHGRSYEIFVGDELKTQHALALWQDEYGNYFSSLSTKGNNFSSPHVYESLTAPSGYIPHGLQETDAFLRIVRSSQILREAGVDTEMIVRVVEPKYFRYHKLDEQGNSVADDFEYVPLPEFKRRLLIDHWKEISSEENALEEFQKVSKAIEEMSFFVTVRATTIGLRLQDFAKSSIDQFDKNLQKLFHFMNVANRNDSREFKVSSNNPEDIRWYFTELLPIAIGRNLGLMHKNGLVHNFAVQGNITALGGLVDLDGVRGEPLSLGDKPPAQADFFNEVDKLTRKVEPDGAMFLRQLVSGALVLAEIKQRSQSDIHVGRALSSFESNLIGSYLASRYDFDTMQPKAGEALPIVKDGLEFNDGRVLLWRWLKPLVEQVLDTTDLPPALNEAEMSKAKTDFSVWFRKNLKNLVVKTHNEILQHESVGELWSEPGSLSFGALQEAALQQANMVLYHHVRETYIEPAQTAKQCQLIEFAKAHRRTQSDWSDEAIAQLIEMAQADLAKHELLASLKSDGGFMRSVVDKIELSVIHALGPIQAPGAKGFNILFNGKAGMIIENVALTDLLEGIAAGLAPATAVNVKGLKSEKGSFSFKITNGDRLHQIFSGASITGGGGMKIKELDSNLSGSVKVTVPINRIKDYLVWTTANHKKDEYKIHIRTAKNISKEELAEILQQRGFNVTLSDKITSEIIERYNPKMIAALNQIEE